MSHRKRAQLWRGSFFVLRNTPKVGHNCQPSECKIPVHYKSRYLGDTRCPGWHTRTLSVEKRECSYLFIFCENSSSLGIGTKTIWNMTVACTLFSSSEPRQTSSSLMIWTGLEVFLLKLPYNLGVKISPSPLYILVIHAVLTLP